MKCLLEQLPSIVAEGKKEAERRRRWMEQEGDSVVPDA